MTQVILKSTISLFELGGHEKSEPIKVIGVKESKLTSTILKLPRIVILDFVWRVMSEAIKWLKYEG